jgi:hypothetical protein
VSAGAPFTLNAAVSDSNSGGVVVQVAFYQDFNVDGILQRGTDLLLGYGAKNADGTWSLTFDMTALASGSYTFFAVALDDYGVFSDPFKLNLQVL